MAPLARACNLSVESDARLEEGAGGDDVLALIKELPDDIVALCSHGDVIPEVIDLLSYRGVAVAGGGCEKGSIWRLDRRHDEIVQATYLGRPS
jgi:hypothetical protein